MSILFSLACVLMSAIITDTVHASRHIAVKHQLEIDLEAARGRKGQG